VFSDVDKHIIKLLRTNTGWTWGGLNALLSKVDNNKSFHCEPDSGLPRTTRAVDNAEQIEILVLSQEDAPQMNCTQRQIA